MTGRRRSARSKLATSRARAARVTRLGVCNPFVAPSAGVRYSPVQPAERPCLYQRAERRVQQQSVDRFLRRRCCSSSTCEEAFIGNVAVDSPCSSNFDCANGLVCARPGEAPVCGPVSPKSLNDPCADPGDECQGASYCAAVPNAAPKCVPAPATGAACSSTVLCGSGDDCVGGLPAARRRGSRLSKRRELRLRPLLRSLPARPVCDGALFRSRFDDCNGIAGAESPRPTQLRATPAP